MSPRNLSKFLPCCRQEQRGCSGPKHQLGADPMQWCETPESLRNSLGMQPPQAFPSHYFVWFPEAKYWFYSKNAQLEAYEEQHLKASKNSMMGWRTLTSFPRWEQFLEKTLLHVHKLPFSRPFPFPLKVIFKKKRRFYWDFYGLCSHYHQIY